MSIYECDQCGECCRRLPIEIEESDLIREPRLIGRCEPIRMGPGMILVDEEGFEVAEIIPGYGAGAMLACGIGSPCQMLDGNLCSIHETKPDVCRDCEPGGVSCQRARGMAGLQPLEVKGA